MSYLNSITFVGFVGADPEQQRLQRGDPIYATDGSVWV
jgi:single-stranded DNA-binding protein